MRKRKIKLAPCELRVLERLVLGEKPKQAAHVLGINYTTFKSYALRIGKKTGANSDAKRVILAIALGMGTPLLDEYKRWA